MRLNCRFVGLILLCTACGGGSSGGGPANTGGAAASTGGAAASTGGLSARRIARANAKPRRKRPRDTDISHSSFCPRSAATVTAAAVRPASVRGHGMSDEAGARKRRERKQRNADRRVDTGRRARRSQKRASRCETPAPIGWRWRAGRPAPECVRIELGHPRSSETADQFCDA
jgi:hypothetical protein